MHNLLIACSFFATTVIACLFAAFPGQHELPSEL